VNSPVRAFNSVGGEPLIIASGKGAKFYDVDGNEYTDYCLSWGALIYGHAHRNAVIAAKKTANNGFSFGTTTRAEIDIAQFIVENIPSIDLIRFVNSGTEATMSAIRVARGFTKRSLLVKFDGCYHGHFDDLLTIAGSGVAQLPESSSLGISESHLKNTLSLPFNDIEILEETLTKYKNDIACVIIEPVAGNMGVIPADKTFLQKLRDLTSRFGIVLIFDEIMTGFRAGRHGAQADYDVIPDMTCLGKIMGGGFPIGAYGGRKEIMRCLAPLGGVYQAGTFSGNPVVMRAGLATLKLLSDSFYKTLNQRADDFSGSMNQFFEEEDIRAHFSRYKGMMSLRFRKEEVKNYKDARDASGGERYAKLFQHLLKTGIYWPPADLEAFFISGMHTKKDLQKLSNELKVFFGKS
jgi:glutamate-1-semialdehyde 2,1-aminomutase